MIRFVMGLSIACLIAGCGGDDADAAKDDDKKDASTTPATATENVATTEPAAEPTGATTEESAQETQEAALKTVKFKVPGMT